MCIFVGFMEPWPPGFVRIHVWVCFRGILLKQAKAGSAIFVFKLHGTLA